MIYFGLKETRNTIEIFPSIKINLQKKSKNDLIIISWIIWQFIVGYYR